MNHIAIDLGGLKSQICVRKADGELVFEGKLDTQALKLFFRGQKPSRVVMETCAESIAVAAWAQEAGHDARVVPATLVRSLGVGARGIKTDVRDARALSEASCRMELRGVHLRSQTARERQTIIGMRSGLVSARTMLINTVKGWLRTQAARLRTHTPGTFPEAVEAYLGEHGGVPPHVARQLASIRMLTEQIESANAELKVSSREDKTLQLLTSVPGVGPVTATCFASVVDTPHRFASSKALASYLGLTPGEASSSGRVQRTSITKAGPAMLRQLLVQCAWTVWNSRVVSDLKRWALQVAERRGKRVAVVALARKLAIIMYAIWRDESAFTRAAA